MSYVDGMADVMDQIGQIQSVFAAFPGSGSGNFESIMQQVASNSSAAGSSSTGSSALGTDSGGAASTDLSGSYGWPLEESSQLTPAELVALGDSPSGDAPGTTSAGTTSAGTTSAGTTSAGTTSAGTADSGATTATGVPGSTGSALPVGAGIAGLGETSALSGPSSFGQAVVADAQKYLGVPYQWGGTNAATGVDCSGLVKDVFNDLGVTLPRTADEQSQVGTPVANLSNAQPGDLVFFAGADGTASAPGHVGIYIGNGQMIDAPHTGTDVRTEPVSDAGTPVAIRRISSSSSSVNNVLEDNLDDITGPAGTSAALPGNITDIDASASSGASAYQSQFVQASATYGVPEQLLSAVAQTESSYNPQAVSAAGAEGLMQLMPATASSLGVDPFNPTQAINGAASLLSSYHQQYGSWSLALAAYNAGPGAVEQFGGVPPYAQTQAYVQNVLSRAGMDAQ